MSVASRPDEVLPLAADFPARTHEEWQGLAAKVVNRGRAEGAQSTGEQAEESLTYTTVDGLTIKPLYARFAGEEVPPTGYPGEMPFTRGTGPRPSDTPWDVRALHDDSDAQVTKDAVLLDLERGVTSVWLEVGAHAVAADDVAGVLADVMLDLAPVVVSSDDDQRAAADALLAVFRERRLTPERAAGGLGYDPLVFAARHGGEPDTAPMVEAARTCLAEFPQVRAVTVDTRLYHDAGAGDVDELGVAIATGIAHVRTLVEAGLSPADAFSQVDFRVSATADQFVTIARLRALRRLWARVGEELGVPEELRGARQHAVSSRRMISRDDPWVNILRGTMACFAASAGGAEAITVLPFDTAWGLPDAFARRVARNTQLLLAQESNVGRVADPAGGSPFVEELTDELARAGWAWMQEIEAAGGMAAALAGGLVADRIAATADERARRLATRDLPLTGVSSFPNPTEPALERRPRPEVPVEGAFAPRRDSREYEELRDASRAFEAAHGSAPAVPLLCLGTRRDFGARETFTTSVLGAAGLTAPQLVGSVEELTAALAEQDSPVAILCSSPKQYAQAGHDVARAAREAGVRALYIAGKADELGEHAGDVDGECRVGSDVLALLRSVQSELGVGTDANTSKEQA